MTANSLYPSYVKIDYHSIWGTHVMTVPCKQWSGVTSPGGKGQFDSWSGSPKDADDMIKDYVDLLAPFWLASSSFDMYTIYNMSAPDATPDPVAANSLGVAGTSVSVYWAKAVQTTFTIRTDGFGIMRVVMLDAPNPNSFDRIASFSASPEALALVAALANSANGWAGRDGTKPGTLSQIAYTLNEKLRREYNMN